MASDDTLAYSYRAEVRVAWLAAADVGSLTVAALERPELAGQAFVVSGEESFDGHELAATFSEGLGRSIITGAAQFFPWRLCCPSAPNRVASP